VSLQSNLTAGGGIRKASNREERCDSPWREQIIRHRCAEHSLQSTDWRITSRDAAPQFWMPLCPIASVLRSVGKVRSVTSLVTKFRLDWMRDTAAGIWVGRAQKGDGKRSGAGYRGRWENWSKAAWARKSSHPQGRHLFFHGKADRNCQPGPGRHVRLGHANYSKILRREARKPTTPILIRRCARAPLEPIPPSQRTLLEIMSIFGKGAAVAPFAVRSRRRCIGPLRHRSACAPE